jgi:hypothetical protein
MTAALHFSPSRCRVRQAVMDRDDRQLQHTFNRHNENCNGNFCSLSLLEDCMAQCIADGIETSAKNVTLNFRHGSGGVATSLPTPPVAPSFGQG